MAPKKISPKLPPKLTVPQQDLLWHLNHGYQLEVGAVESAPLLRRLKDDTIIRPASVNRSTIRALEERGLIGSAESDDKLTTVWHAKK